MTTKDSSKKIKERKGIKYNYFTLTIQLCMFVIVADKLPLCLLVQQDITVYKDYKADCFIGNVQVFFRSNT